MLACSCVKSPPSPPLLTSPPPPPLPQLSTISVRLLQTLERFRKDQIIKAKDEKKRFDKSSHSYYTALDRHLAASPRKKDMQLAEVRS